MKMPFIMLWALVLIIIASLVGCAGWLSSFNDAKLGNYTYTNRPAYDGVAKVIPIWIDKNFGQADMVSIGEAVNQWNYALNGYIKLEIVDTTFDMEVPKIVEQVRQGGWLIMKIYSDNPLVSGVDDQNHWTLAFAEQIGGHHIYLIRDRINNSWIYGITMHEIGHLLGAPHVGNRLMYPHFTIARFRCIDYDTIWAVAGYNDLQLDGLNYCVDGKNIPVEKPTEDNIVNCQLTDK